MMMIAVERQRDILVSSENYPQSNGSASFFYQEAWSDHSTLNSNLEKVYNLRKASRGRKLYRIDRELGSLDVTARLFNDLVCGVG